jgi:hypothetical protein
MSACAASPLADSLRAGWLVVLQLEKHAPTRRLQSQHIAMIVAAQLEAGVVAMLE